MLDLLAHERLHALQRCARREDRDEAFLAIEQKDERGVVDQMDETLPIPA